jgi:hypothetical protein
MPLWLMITHLIREYEQNMILAIFFKFVKYKF